MSVCELFSLDLTEVWDGSATTSRDDIRGEYARSGRKLVFMEKYHNW